LPAARPSAFTTAAGKLIERFARCSERVHDGEARGRDAVALHEALGEDLARLEPRAAERLGPKTAMPASRTRSATPAASAVSGPTTTRSIRSLCARSTIARVSVARRRRSSSPRVAVPALPGA
jgi:hypothetical protein